MSGYEVASDLRKQGCCKESVISDVVEMNLRSGDVLLIEIQTSFGNQSDLPLEVEPAILAVLKKATFFLGITIIEAAGNGQVLLDTWEPTPGGGQPLNRQGTTFLDSGAVLVGAVDPLPPYGRQPYSNYGNRIDCVAWGDDVWTSGYDDSKSSSSAGHKTDYWYFSGTSSAAALVAGMAAQVQGMQLAKVRVPFPAAQLRAILSCPNNGTACPTDLASFFGMMPDMEKLIKNLGY